MALLRNRQVIIIITACLFLYAAAGITGLVVRRSLLLIASMNAISGIVMITYWLWYKLRPFKRTTEKREWVVLSVEGLFVVLAIHTMVSNPSSDWVAIIQYCIFIVHAVVLVMLLVFLLTFKIKKIF